MESLTIRLAVPEEHELLEALQWRASLNNVGDREVLLANPDAIEIEIEQLRNGDAFVAILGARIVGFATLVVRSDNQFELDGLFVEPGMWRRGIGRSLIEHCKSIVASRGGSVLNVIGNPHARKFYDACGFDYVGAHETRFGVGMTLIKKLASG